MCKKENCEYCAHYGLSSFFSPSYNPSVVTVYLGRQSQELSNPNEVSRKLSRVIRHPNYNSGTNVNDIALMRLSSPVTFTNYIRPVCLAASGSTFFSSIDSWITGWGDIGSGREYNKVKRRSILFVEFHAG